MTREEAKLELQAATLRPQDVSEEVRGMLEKDEDLKRWFQEQVTFDEEVARLMEGAVVIPAGLRDRLVKGTEAGKGRAGIWVRSGVVAALAACVVLGWALFWPDDSALEAWEAESLVAVAKVNYGLSRLDGRAGSLEAVKELLVKSGAVSPMRVPVLLSQLATHGCKRVQIRGRPATIVCFKLPAGGEAHLVVLESAGLGEGVPEGRAKFEKRKNWSLASWSDGGQTYLLATTAGEEELRRLMGEA